MVPKPLRSGTSYFTRCNLLSSGPAAMRPLPHWLQGSHSPHFEPLLHRDMPALVTFQGHALVQRFGKAVCAAGLILTRGLRRTGLALKAQGWHNDGHMSSGSCLPKAQDRPFCKSGQDWLYLRHTHTHQIFLVPERFNFNQVSCVCIYQMVTIRTI